MSRKEEKEFYDDNSIKTIKIYENNVLISTEEFQHNSVKTEIISNGEIRNFYMNGKQVKKQKKIINEDNYELILYDKTFLNEQFIIKYEKKIFYNQIFFIQKELLFNKNGFYDNFTMTKEQESPDYKFKIILKKENDKEILIKEYLLIVYPKYYCLDENEEIIKKSLHIKDKQRNIKKITYYEDSENQENDQENDFTKEQEIEIENDIISSLKFFN